MKKILLQKINLFKTNWYDILGNLPSSFPKERSNFFYETEVLKVYEIVNEPRESKISDLIF